MGHVVHMVEPRVSWSAGEEQPNACGGGKYCTRDEEVNGISMAKGKTMSAYANHGCMGMHKGTKGTSLPRETPHAHQQQSRIRHVPTGMFIVESLLERLGLARSATLNPTKAQVGEMPETEWREPL